MIDLKEYGGCLPLEIGAGEEYWHRYREIKIDVDSGRSAIQYILQTNNYKRIWLPVYNCPLVRQRIIETCNIKIQWYNLNDDFSPMIS